VQDAPVRELRAKFCEVWTFEELAAKKTKLEFFELFLFHFTVSPGSSEGSNYNRIWPCDAKIENSIWAIRSTIDGTDWSGESQTT
jgi:hypothetical protein